MKGFGNSTIIIPISLCFIFIFIYHFEDVLAAPSRHLCSPEQRDALLAFKTEFEIGKPNRYCMHDSFKSHPRTESWGNNSDCCSWKGIKCNAKSGDVIELDLHCSFLHGRFHSNSSLQKLPFLTILDLSFNDFYGQVPSSIGNLSSHLIALQLTDNNFRGPIPYSIGNLSHLTFLDLSGNNLVGEIPYSIGNLSHLTFLDLPENNLVGEIPSSIGKLSHLTMLDLSENNLVGEIPSSFGNLNKLTNFEASNNAFTGTIPSSLFTIPSLTEINLIDNQLNGTLEFGNTSSSPSNLQYLVLGRNNFKGPIPRSISKLVNLEYLHLSHFDTQGRPVDFSIFSHLKSLGSLYLSNLNTTTTIDLNDILSYSKSLSTLDLSGNHVSTTNKSSISQLIAFLSLSGCGITEFPAELLRTQHEVAHLDISNNKIEGQVPGWLWTLPNLYYVNLSNNTFIGFERSKKKQGLSSVWKPSMVYLLGSNNNFTGKIPSFICELRSLETLDLSENKFNGLIPPCLGNLKSTLSVLNLRQNNLSGGLPEDIIFESLSSLDVGHNQLVGKLPRSLNRFSTLEVLNVESNRINDTFPFWLGSLQKLQFLVLRSNAFYGPIHQASFPQLRIIDISHNHFDGTLPSEYFSKWTAMSSLEPDEDQSSEKYMRGGSRYYYDSLVLMNKGVELELVRILKIFTTIDFSGNKFEGEIPKSIGLLKELRILNLSSNAFAGRIPSSMGNLTALESLDVSQNKLSGEIPKELGNLSYLEYMNFSHNQLSGLVPGGTQFPELLRTQHEMILLDISNNKIEGQVPGWLWTLPNLYYVNLSNNTFIGFERSNKKQGLSSVWKPSVSYLLGSNNNFTGKIPSFICELRSLETLDLSENKFNGLIPPCLGNLKSTLSVLNLRQNNLSGGLPEDIIFESLRSLDVGHNQLVGKLPRSLNRFSTLQVLNVESNRINDTFPFWLGSLQKLQVLVLRSNAFYGPIHQASFPQLRIIDISHNHFDGTLPSEYFSKWTAMSSLEPDEDQSSEKYMRGGSGYYYDSLVLMNKGVEMELVRILKILTAIDFSGNKFEGEIPKSIGLMKELCVLNLSNNAFTSRIPSSMGNMKALESLDVSQNKLSGEIPQELGDLSFLAYMNFSHNQLSGLVPGGTQFRTQRCSSFEDNMGLVGSSLNEICKDAHTSATQVYETLESEEEDEEVISWIAAAIGFIPGLFCGLTIGYILLSYKPKWFMNPFGRNNRRRRSTRTQ